MNYPDTMSFNSGDPRSPYFAKMRLSNSVSSALQNDLEIVDRVTDILQNAYSEVQMELGGREDRDAFDLDEVLGSLTYAMDSLPTEKSLRARAEDRS
ncbi:hypothetical protein [Kozakia baliensis]|uniref:hypothetical protein n=1 Tax=Kozakia baliensis TaxID=153496 RepID=UPI00087B877F|nr:hypothetical protein [Kozakia baliensis]AOX19983.1 hypothetical protein A0U90_06440 [Kozakia baliensis]